MAAKTDPHCGDVGCVLDCLDECEESTRKGLIELMVRLQTVRFIKGMTSHGLVGMTLVNPRGDAEGYLVSVKGNPPRLLIDWRELMVPDEEWLLRLGI